MSVYYSIDDGHGNNICSGIQFIGPALVAAQEHADEHQECVLVYASDDSYEEIVWPRSAS